MEQQFINTLKEISEKWMFNLEIKNDRAYLTKNFQKDNWTKVKYIIYVREFNNKLFVALYKDITVTTHYNIDKHNIKIVSFIIEKDIEKLKDTIRVIIANYL